ncbi:TonB-dependent receptor [Aequorivita aquimaris]|uniref:TonB-dependent receptor n=1 Tax=Aequorivita aquimaris TaxID=1548749 RepID=A0A137RLQ6_9FLAO|nr:SusC/RagA family TonB-linked outer membrane protein [Aequorivita aquimaris]KXO01105.1 TonB-dependent receptor [Aequorivita aquimaris]
MKNYYRRSYALALTFALFLTYYSPTFSQNQPQKTISGIITDGDGPLGGVNVLVKNSARGSISDLEGRYSVTAAANDTLVFTYVGYKLQEVAVGSNNIMNVVMEVDAQALDAVVINAGYYKVSDREKTGSIARITAAQIENQPVSNPLAAMQGRMAGVNIVQNTGVPGGGFSVRIRGRNSIRADGSEPLYIVDGVPYPSQSLGDSRVSTVLGYVPQSPLNGINPNDIESIEVLKDADATAIYGSRGANGVVLITTKKGKGGKTTFEIGSSTGVGKIKHRMELLNTQQYLSMRREAFANDGITEYPSFDYDINGTWDQNRYTDWQDELLGGTAYYNNAHASVQGGNEQTRFLVKGSYGEQSTVLPGDYKYKKSSILLNLNHSTADDKFSIQISGNYVVDKNNLPATNLVREALTLPPNAPALYNENGELNWEDNTFDNPLAALNAKYKSNANYLRANTVLSYTPFKGFGLKANLGYFATSLEETRTAPHTIYKPSFGLDSSYSILTINNGDLSSWIIEPQATYTLGLGKGVLDILVGTTLQNDNADQLFQSARDFPSNTVIYNAAAAAIHTIESDTEEMYRYRALFGRINFNWDKKYIVNLTARRDGSSRFGAENRFANFGAVGAAYIFSEEPFMAKVFPFINFGKLRASYGTTGNDQIGNYGYLNTYTTNGLSYQGNQTLSPVQLYNPDFGWETNRKLEAAIELGILNDRIMLSTSYYRNRSSSQLVGIPLPGTTGFTSIQSNLDATVQNTGLEFELNTVNLKTDSFTWNTSINLTIPKNKLLSFPQLENSTYANQYVVGQPLDIQLLYQSTGVDPQTGVYTFLDVDGDGIISNPNDRKAIRDVGPKFYGGLSNSITYKMFQLDFLFQLVKQEARNYLSDTPFPGIMRNQPTAILDQWQNPGDDASIQLFSAGYNNGAYLAYINSYNATGAIGDASFVRLKNIALSYNLPSQIATNVDCRIFLTGQNLFTITKYLGPDPETLSIGNLPPLSVLTMGVEFKI